MHVLYWQTKFPTKEGWWKTTDQLTKVVNATLQTLKLTQGQAITTIKDIAYLSTERIQNNLTKKVEEVHDLRTEIQELLFDVKNKQQEIIQQGKEIEEHVNLI